jgi:hypothetical protein
MRGENNPEELDPQRSEQADLRHHLRIRLDDILELLRSLPQSFPDRETITTLITKAAAVVERSTSVDAEEKPEDVATLVDRRWAEEQDAWRAGILDEIKERDKQ